MVAISMFWGSGRVVTSLTPTGPSETGFGDLLE
jgi:hypothetical protein